jgi:hypothetical protein
MPGNWRAAFFQGRKLDMKLKLFVLLATCLALGAGLSGCKSDPDEGGATKADIDKGLQGMPPAEDANPFPGGGGPKKGAAGGG